MSSLLQDIPSLNIDVIADQFSEELPSYFKLSDGKMLSIEKNKHLPEKKIFMRLVQLCSNIYLFIQTGYFYPKYTCSLDSKKIYSNNKAHLGKTITALLFTPKKIEKINSDLKKFSFEHQFSSSQLPLNFQKDIAKILSRIFTLQQNQITQLIRNDIHLTLARNKKNYIDIRLQGKELGSGTFKTACVSYSLLKHIRKADIKLKNTLTGQDKQRAQKSLKSECIISQKLIQDVPFILKMKQLEDYENNDIHIESELCEKENFSHLMYKKEIPRSLKLEIAQKVAEGLSKMHKRGYCHLDVKVSNILLKKMDDNTIDPRIADFGFTESIGAPKTEQKGTPYCIAPEMFDPKTEQYTEKMDVFSFGVLLFDLILEHQKLLFPLDCNKKFTQMNSSHQEKIQTTFRRNPDPIYLLIADCVQLNPENRPTMEEVSHRILEYNRGEYGAIEHR